MAKPPGNNFQVLISSQHLSENVITAMPRGKDHTNEETKNSKESREAAVKQMPRIPKKPKGYRDSKQQAEERGRVFELAKKIERRNLKWQREHANILLDLAPNKANSSTVPRYTPTTPTPPTPATSNVSAQGSSGTSVLPTNTPCHCCQSPASSDRLYNMKGIIIYLYIYIPDLMC